MNTKNTIFSLFLILILAGFGSLPVRAQTMGDYSTSPILVADAVAPNVMIVYSNDHTNFYGGYNDVATYDNNTDYYGYFDSFKCYNYSSGVFVPASITADHKCGGNWSGNFLNWVTMTHGDFVRKAITGGRRSIDANSKTVLEGAEVPDADHAWKRVHTAADLGSYTPFTAPYSFCRPFGGGQKPLQMWTRSGNNSDCTNSGQSDKFFVRVEVCNSAVGLEDNCSDYSGGGGTFKPKGLVLRYRDQMNFGLITYSHGLPETGGIVRRNIEPIDDELNSNGTVNSGVAGIMRYINEFTPKGWDPVAEAYYEAVRYFKGQTPTAAYFPANNDDSFPVFGNQSPTRTWSDPQEFSCQKGFIVVVNDEYPSRDHDDLPGSCGSTVTDPDINVQTLTGTVGAAEGINGNDFQIGNVSCSQNDDTCSVKTISNLGTARGICPSEPGADGSFHLAGLSYYAHITDLSALSGTQNITTYTIAFRASPGGYTPPTDNRLNPMMLAAKYGGFEDQNGNNLPDLQDEWDSDGDGNPDTFQAADRGSDFEEALAAAFTEILQRASSGTAVSVLATSASGEGNIFQAYFLPAFQQTVGTEIKTVTWIGHLLKLGVDAFGNLLDKNDDPIHFEFDDAQGQTVVVNESSGLETLLPNFDGFLWDAGEVLQSTTPSGY